MLIGESGSITFVCGVVSSDELCWAVLLLVLNSDASRLVADSLLIVASLSGVILLDMTGNQLLYWRLQISIQKLLYVASSKPHLFTLLFAFFPLRILASGLWSLCTIILVPRR